MRAGAGFAAMGNAAPAASPPAMEHSAWRSPVPYLFGGLAAMLGLIAFALLILACSYWRLSSYLDDADDERRREEAAAAAAAAGGKTPDAAVRAPPCFCEGFVVIMAGDEKPTFLATPISARPAPAADDGGNVTAADFKEGAEIANAPKDEGAPSAEGCHHTGGDPTADH